MQIRPRQFTVGIKRTDSTNFVLLIKLFELDIPFEGRQAFSKSNLVLEPHLFNGLGAYSTLNSIKIFTIGSASFVFKSNHLLWCKANLIFFDFNRLLLESNKIYHLSAVQAVCSEPCHCISTYQTPRHWPTTHYAALEYLVRQKMALLCCKYVANMLQIAPKNKQMY